MSIELLELAASALGEDLLAEVVFVGAATLPLWITDPAAPPMRPTTDVDVVVEASTLRAFNGFEERLRDAGFRDDGHVLGRFRHGDLQLDAILADASMLGFENRWQRESLADALSRDLPSGAEIRVLAPANLLATKLEAFSGRGNGDYLASPDFEDIVALVDGREELIDEVTAATPALREYLAEQLSHHIPDTRAIEAIAAHLEHDRGGRERARLVVVPRMARSLLPAAEASGP